MGDLQKFIRQHFFDNSWTKEIDLKSLTQEKLRFIDLSFSNIDVKSKLCLLLAFSNTKPSTSYEDNKHIENIFLQALDEENNLVKAVATILHSKQSLNYLNFDISPTNDIFGKNIEKLLKTITDSWTDLTETPLLAEYLGQDVLDESFSHSQPTVINLGFVPRSKPDSEHLKEVYLEKLKDECQRRRVHVPIPGRSVTRQDDDDTAGFIRRSSESSTTPDPRRKCMFPRVLGPRNLDIMETTKSPTWSGSIPKTVGHANAIVTNGSPVQKDHKPMSLTDRITARSLGASNLRKASGIKLLDYDELPAFGPKAKQLRKEKERELKRQRDDRIREEKAARTASKVARQVERDTRHTGILANIQLPNVDNSGDSGLSLLGHDNEDGNESWSKMEENSLNQFNLLNYKGFVPEGLFNQKSAPSSLTDNQYMGQEDQQTANENPPNLFNAFGRPMLCHPRLSVSSGLNNNSNNNGTGTVTSITYGEEEDDDDDYEEGLLRNQESKAAYVGLNPTYRPIFSQNPTYNVSFPQSIRHPNQNTMDYVTNTQLQQLSSSIQRVSIDNSQFISNYATDQQQSIIQLVPNSGPLQSATIQGQTDAPTGIRLMINVSQPNLIQSSPSVFGVSSNNNSSTQFGTAVPSFVQIVSSATPTKYLVAGPNFTSAMSVSTSPFVSSANKVAIKLPATPTVYPKIAPSPASIVCPQSTPTRIIRIQVPNADQNTRPVYFSSSSSTLPVSYHEDVGLTNVIRPNAATAAYVLDSNRSVILTSQTHEVTQQQSQQQQLTHQLVQSPTVGQSQVIKPIQIHPKYGVIAPPKITSTQSLSTSTYVQILPRPITSTPSVLASSTGNNFTNSMRATIMQPVGQNPAQSSKDQLLSDPPPLTHASTILTPVTMGGICYQTMILNPTSVASSTSPSIVSSSSCQLVKPPQKQHGGMMMTSQVAVAPNTQLVASSASSSTVKIQDDLSLTENQLNIVRNLFQGANRVTRPEKAMILSFIAGSKDNPLPETCNTARIRLSEYRERVLNQATGQLMDLAVDTFLNMDYSTGKYEKVKSYRMDSMENLIKLPVQTGGI